MNNVHKLHNIPATIVQATTLPNVSADDCIAWPQADTLSRRCRHLVGTGIKPLIRATDRFKTRNP